MVRRSVYQDSLEVYSTSRKFPNMYFVWKWSEHGYSPKFRTKSFSNLSSLPKVDFKLHQGDIASFFQEDNQE